MYRLKKKLQVKDYVTLEELTHHSKRYFSLFLTGAPCISNLDRINSQALLLSSE